MKKSIILSVASLATLCVLSCQKESNELVPEVTPEIETNKEVEPNPNFVPTKALSFVGTVDDEVSTGTKTSLDGKHIKWAANEGIYLFDGVAPRAFTSDNDAVASTVNFNGVASDVAKYYAIYPSGKLGTSGDKKVITTTIPTFQTATANSFAPKANVAVAYSETDPTGAGALQFKNIGAVVKFKINDENTDVRKVRLDAINGEDMSGKATVTFETDGSFSTASVHANSESCVILNSGSETDLDPTKPYYMAIKPGTYEGGFRITFIRADGSFRSFSNTTSNTLDRNELMDFGDFPKITSWKTPVSDELTATLINQASYGDWLGKTSVSSAVYAGNSQTASDSYENAIQIRSNNSNSGIVSTTSGGKVKKVIVDWQSGTVDGRTLNIYGNNNAYTSATNLYSVEDATKGTLLGSIVKGTSTEFTITGDYEYIGLRSADGAMYMKSVKIIWGDCLPSEPIVVAQTTSVTGLSAENVPLSDASATFNVVSNGPYTVTSSNPEYASLSVSDSDVVTVSFTNLASGTRYADITVSPAEGAAPDVVRITQKDVPATKTYTLTINSTTLTKTTTSTGYAGYNGDRTIVATAADKSEYNVIINTNNVMINSGNIQFKTSTGHMYNKTDLGRIISISSITGVGQLIGTSVDPSEAVANGGYFKLYSTGTTPTTSSITITFQK